MDTFFFYYIDLLMLVISLLLAYIFTIRFSRQAILPVRKGLLFLLLFGATTVVSYMCGHSGEIMYRAIQQILADTFVYNFKFYSLNLMGIVFLGISIHMLLQAKEWVSGNLHAKKNFARAAVVLILLSAPTFPFTPIGILPTIACVISLIAQPFVIKITEKEYYQQI